MALRIKKQLIVAASNDLMMSGANLWSAKPLLRFEFCRRREKLSDPMQSGAGVPHSKVRQNPLTKNNEDKRQILNQIISLNLVDSVGEFSG